MRDKLTIVIPCKNESITIYDCINTLSNQFNITSTQIIIADNSDETESLQWIGKLQDDFGKKLKINIIKGGFPAKARLEGSKLVKTPYLLFLDADVMLYDYTLLYECLNYEEELVSVPFKTEKNWNWVYNMFDFFQWMSIKLGTPFAVGGFQLWKTESYWKCGGYDETELFAEDYSLSSKVSKLKIHKTSGVWTSARRFKNKGVIWMFRIMILSYLNRNNSEFFKQHHDYWT